MKPLTFATPTFGSRIAAALYGRTRSAIILAIISLMALPLAGSALAVGLHRAESFSFALDAGYLASGENCHGTVTLGAKAPAGGVTINVSSSSDSVTVPSTVIVASGSESVRFNITTVTVAAQTAVTITASGGGESQTATLTLTPPTLGSLGINPGIVAGGGTCVGTVYLSNLAPPGGAIVQLSSSSTYATVPATVSIPAGQRSGTFEVTTYGATTKAAVTITAKYGAATESNGLYIGAFQVSSIVLNPASLLGGTWGSGTVSLNAPAPSGGAVVTLTTSNFSALVPPTVNIPEGSSSATFSIATNPVAKSSTVLIYASYGFNLGSVPLTISAATVSTFAISQNSVVGGTTTNGTVTLSGPAPVGGFEVTLSSSSSDATVPAKFIIPAGQSYGSFEISTKKVKSQTTLEIKATFGTASQSATLTLIK